MRYEYRDKERDLIDEETGEVLATEPLAEDYAAYAKKVAAAMKKAQPIFKTPHNHDTDAVALATATLCPETSKAQQSYKDEANIINIVEKYMRTGELPLLRNPPTHQDFEDTFDFQSSLDQVRAAEAAFAALPAKIRKEFDNDPGQYVEGVERLVAEKNWTELERLGLRTPPPKPEEPPKPPTPPGGVLQPPEGGKGASEAPKS